PRVPSAGRRPAGAHGLWICVPDDPLLTILPPAQSPGRRASIDDLDVGAGDVEVRQWAHPGLHDHLLAAPEHDRRTDRTDHGEEPAADERPAGPVLLGDP